MTFTKMIQEYIDAAYPILYVQTHEEDRAVAALLAVEGAKTVWMWSCPALGWRCVRGEGGMVKTAGAVEAVTSVAGMPLESLFILKDFHHYVANPAVSRAIRDALPGYRRTRTTLVLISPALTVPVELDKDVAAVPFELPGRDELGAIFDRVVGSAEATGSSAPAVTERAAIVEAGRGLTEAEAESAFTLALIRSGAFDGDAAATVRGEKAGALKRSGLVTWVTPSVGVDDIGGLERLKAYARGIAPIFRDPSGAEAFGLLPEDFPRSILLAGMPGCGKSMAAEALSSLLGIGCVRTDFSRIMSGGGGDRVGRAGASEDAVLRRNALVEAQAPIEDWWDEAEKGLGMARGDSTANPWEARAGGSILTWLESYRAPVLVVATVNRPELLTPEMLSRFQVTFFVGLPSADERRTIVRLLLARRRVALPEGAVDAVAEATHGYSGRELRNAVQATLQRAFAGGSAVTGDALIAAVRTITPLSVSRADELRRIEAWAKDNDVEDASGPADYSQGATPPARRIRRK